MKKTVCLLIVLIVLLLVCSCDHDIIGSRGPAGGWIFYDCDADNDETNDGAGPDGLKSSVCGWRYLEAAPSDKKLGSSTTGIVFGYYRATPGGNNLFVNGSSYYYEEGTSSATDGKCTGTAIGTGKANTEKLVDKMGSAAYTSSSGSDTTADYAAKFCDDYTYGGYSDWFLPSKDELNLMYENLQGRKYGFDTVHYWSSSEYDGFPSRAWFRSFHKDGQGYDHRSYIFRVRAIRAFL